MIAYIETHIVDHCNLCCKGCSHFSGLAKPFYKDVQEFEKEVIRLGEIGVDTFRIMGGEPLLHPEWMKFLEIARHYMPRTDIVLVTNGLLAHKIDPFVDRLNKLNISVCISDYGLNRKLNDDLRHKQIHSKGFLYNISLDLKGRQNPRRAFNACDLSQSGWYFLKKGRLYSCCVMANIDIFNEHFLGGIEYELEDVSISIYESESDIKKFLKTPHKACKYCNTEKRKTSHVKFSASKGDIKEWTV